MIKRIYRYLYSKVCSKLNPVKFAIKIGVNFSNPNNVHIYGNIYWGTEPWLISIGNNVHLTDGIRFETHDGGTLLYRNRIPDLEITKPIVLGDDVYIGNQVIIMPGVSIGSDVIIGAGSIVTKDVPNHSVVAGVPAKHIKTTEEYLQKIINDSIHLGHLSGRKKDRALMKFYHYNGKSKGIWF